MINKERLGKLIIAALVIIMLVIIICGCNKAKADNRRLRTLETDFMYEIYVDDLTGIQYLRTVQGGVCVMVDAEGKPLIWKEEK